ncbi:MAG: hypothetical protein ACK5GK_10870, partial [Akkermansiaceae bacterium]|nr:hypothetical protein [Luteolibacter sp.]
LTASETSITTACGSSPNADNHKLKSNHPNYNHKQKLPHPPNFGVDPEVAIKNRGSFQDGLTFEAIRRRRL